MLRYGSTRELTAEELANAIKLDPSQIAGLVPSLDTLIAMLEECKRKILETYEPRGIKERVNGLEPSTFSSEGCKPPSETTENKQGYPIAPIHRPARRSAVRARSGPLNPLRAQTGRVRTTPIWPVWSRYGRI